MVNSLDKRFTVISRPRCRTIHSVSNLHILSRRAKMGILALIHSLVGILLAYASYRGIYNRYFHPLRHFPWAVLGISFRFKLWAVHTKQIHTLGLEAHKKYGPVIRVTPNLLTFNDPKLLPTVYHRIVDKTDMYKVGALGDLAPPFQTMEYEEHAAKRKRIASSVSRRISTKGKCTVPVPLIPQKFTLTNLNRHESQFDEGIQGWLGALKKRFADTGEKLDNARWSQHVQTGSEYTKVRVPNLSQLFCA